MVAMDMMPDFLQIKENACISRHLAQWSPPLCKAFDNTFHTGAEGQHHRTPSNNTDGITKRGRYGVRQRYSVFVAVGKFPPMSCPVG